MSWSVTNSKHAATNKSLSGKEIKGDQNKSNGNTFHGKHKIENSDVEINQKGKHNQVKLDDSQGNSVNLNQESTSNYGRNIADINGNDNNIDIKHKGGQSSIRTNGNTNTANVDATQAKGTTGVFKGNDFLSEHLNLSETGKNDLLVQGSDFNIGEVTGGEDVDQFIFDGNGEIGSVNTHGGNDEVTFTGDGQIEANVNTGSGDDIVRANGLVGDVEGGEGQDSIHFRDTKGNNDVNISGFENIAIDGDLGADFDWDAGTGLPSDWGFTTDDDGNRSFNMGDSNYAFDSSNPNLKIGDAEYSLDDWYSKFGDVDNGGGTTTTTDLDGTLGDDVLDARGVEDVSVDADYGDDKVYIDSETSGNVNGGPGNDELISEVGFDGYDEVGYNADTNEYRFTHGDNVTTASNFENFDLGGTAYTDAELQALATPYTDDNGNTGNPGDPTTAETLNGTLGNDIDLDARDKDITVNGDYGDDTIYANANTTGVLDGEQGTDTAIFENDLSSYNNLAYDDTAGQFTFTNDNGELITRNIESYEFADGNYTQQELIDYANNLSTNSNLTAVDGTANDDSQTRNGADFFGNLYNGQAGNDTLNTDLNLYDFSNVSQVDINGSQGYEFTNAAGDVSRALNIENFNFGNNALTAADLDAYIANLANTSDTATDLVEDGAGGWNVSQTFGAENNAINWDPATQTPISSFDGGAGHDTLNIAGDLADLQGLFNINGSNQLEDTSGNTTDLTDIEALNVGGTQINGSWDQIIQQLIALFN